MSWKFPYHREKHPLKMLRIRNLNVSDFVVGYERLAEKLLAFLGTIPVKKIIVPQIVARL